MLYDNICIRSTNIMVLNLVSHRDSRTALPDVRLPC